MQQTPSEGSIEPIVYMVLCILLLVAGLALILVAVLGYKRIKTSGPIRVGFKDLFSVETNLAGLVALIGLVLVGAATFILVADYRGKLQESEAERKQFEDQLQAEMQTLEGQLLQANERLDQYERASFEFKLEFPPEALPEDLDAVKVTAVVASKNRPPLPRPMLPRPGVGGVSVNLDDLSSGDRITFHAEDGQHSWKSEPFFEVPAVTLQMKEVRRKERVQ
jgi:hypothetical protein